jgi:Zn-dependent protease with chaperone function
MGILKSINYFGFLITVIMLALLFGLATEIYPATKEYTPTVHTTIYIDRSFDDFEQEIIISSAIKWEEATKHLVKYDIVQMPTHDKIDPKNSLFIVKVSPDNPEVIILDGVKRNTTLAYYTEKWAAPTISVIALRLNEDIYEGVILHEMGHALGLDHIEGPVGYGTLMYPYASMSSDHITHKDLEQFCNLHHCDANKL